MLFTYYPSLFPNNSLDTLTLFGKHWLRKRLLGGGSWNLVAEPVPEDLVLRARPKINDKEEDALNVLIFYSTPPLHSL